MIRPLDRKFTVSDGGWHCNYSNKLQETLRVEPCVELELNLRESDLEPSLLIGMIPY